MKEEIVKITITQKDTQSEVLRKCRALRSILEFQSYRTVSRYANTKRVVSSFCIVENEAVAETIDGVAVPKQFACRNKEMNDYLANNTGIVYLQDEKRFVLHHSGDITRADDDMLWYRRSSLTHTPYGNYANTDGFVEVTYQGERMLCPRDKTTVAKDTGRTVPKSGAREYNGDYYEYEFLLPFYKRNENHPWFFDLTEVASLQERGFGVEFEFKQAEPLSVALFKDQDLHKKWSTVDDGSIRGGGGCEFVSVPLSTRELSAVGDMVDMAIEQKADPASSCGTHIHYSAKDYNYKDIVRLSRFCKDNEETIFKLIEPRRHNNSYCRKLDNRFKFNSSDEERGIEEFYGGRSNLNQRATQSKWAVGHVRHFWLSLDRLFRFKDKPELKTIEFRMFEATLDKAKIFHWINFGYAIVEANKKSTPKCLEDCAPYAFSPEKFSYFIENGIYIEEED